uniref:Uncharacterized protein n=1 Tax=Trichogramma kaykai TaxID=54128 RepID=A0ABD2XRU8_9HYME
MSSKDEIAGHLRLREIKNQLKSIKQGDARAEKYCRIYRKMPEEFFWLGKRFQTLRRMNCQQAAIEHDADDEDSPSPQIFFSPPPPPPPPPTAPPISLVDAPVGIVTRIYYYY